MTPEGRLFSCALGAVDVVPFEDAVELGFAGMLKVETA